MGELTISTPDLSTPQAPKNKLDNINPLIITILLVLFSILCFLLYFILSSKALLSPLERQNFSEDDSISPTITSTSTVTLGLVGDLGLGRYITTISRRKNDFSWPFQQISPWLLSHDFNLANLESPIITNCPEGETGTFIFCGDSKFLPYLRDNKFILNITNNHILNYGQDGLNQTKNFLSQNNITYFPDFTIKNINGLSFGFLGYDFISNPTLDSKILINEVKKYNSQVDYLIVSLHWGNEYLSSPESWRVNLAHQLVDAGADIIFGHHPHVWQGYEIYQNKLIFYSFGNFIFDQPWSYETTHSQIAELTLSKTKIEKLTLSPIEIKFSSQPKISN